MNDFNIDEMMEAAAYVEWKLTMKITSEQEAYMYRPCDQYEIIPKTWFHDDGSIIEQTVEVYKKNNKNKTYEIGNVALYATKVKWGKKTFLENLLTNYQVIKEILRRLGISNDFLTLEKWKDICFRQMLVTVESKKEDKRWKQTRNFMNTIWNNA